MLETIIDDESVDLNEALLYLERRTDSSLSGRLTTELSQYDWATTTLTLEEINGSFNQSFSVLPSGQFNLNSSISG